MAAGAPKMPESQIDDGRGDCDRRTSNFGRGRELTHREDYARNGDYLGRHPGDVSGGNHFDEEYFVDETATPAEVVPEK